MQIEIPEHIKLEIWRELSARGGRALRGPQKMAKAHAALKKNRIKRMQQEISELRTQLVGRNAVPPEE